MTQSQRELDRQQRSSSFTGAKAFAFGLGLNEEAFTFSLAAALFAWLLLLAETPPAGLSDVFGWLVVPLDIMAGVDTDAVTFGLVELPEAFALPLPPLKGGMLWINIGIFLDAPSFVADGVGVTDADFVAIAPAPGAFPFPLATAPFDAEVGMTALDLVAG